MMKALVVALLAIPACAPSSAQSAQPATPEKHYELQHIDVTNVDKSVDPCVNFFQYSCNPYNAANPIPADQSHWGVDTELAMWNRQVLRAILETNQAPNPSRTPNQQKIGDLYASCMTQPANQLDEIKPLLAQIDAIHDKHSLALALAAIHRSFGHVWQGDENQTDVAFFGFGPTADFNDINRVVAGLDQGGLGMPNRDYYLSDTPEMKAFREKYATLVASMLQLSGIPADQSTKDAAQIFALESTLATAQMDNISRRDPNKLNNRFTLAQLKALTPDFDWDVYLNAIGAPAVPLYEVNSPAFFKALNSALKTTDPAVLKLYLRWQLLHAAVPTLGKSWRDTAFVFDSALTGQPKQEPDARRCIAAVDHNLGEALGEVYVSQVFTPDTKARAQKMVKDIEAAMGRDITTVTWMQPATKQQALLKLAAVIDKIGYPDKWIDYSTLVIVRDSYPRNIEHSTAFELHRQLAFIGHPLDKTQWFMTPPTVDAYEDPQTNTINFPAGILQPIFFDPTRDDVINYGAEGAVVGHELTHDFDDQGRKFDVNGNLKDWWTDEDAKQYDQRGSCIAAEYSGAVPGVPGIKQDGKLTQGEDTADNGGLYLAMSALAQDLQAQSKLLDDKDTNGLTNLQRFFIAYAKSWCSQIRPEALRAHVLTDPHSAEELRVNNVVGNMPEFQKAFNCKAGQPEVHVPSCRVW